MGVRTLLLVACRRHARRRRLTPRRCLLPISAANWLSREPAGTLRSQVRGLRPCATAAAAHFGSGATPNVFAWSRTVMPARRKRRYRPWAAAHLVLRPWLPPISPPQRVARCPKPWLVRALSALHELGEPNSWRPLLRLVPLPASWLGHEPPELVLCAAHQGNTRLASSSRLPPTGPVRARLGLRLDRCFSAATNAPALPPGPGFRHAFTPGAPRARPELLAGFRQGSQATCRLSTSAAECPPSTPASSPSPADGHGFWPLCQQAAPPLTSRRRPSCPRPGVSRALARPTPTAATARPGGSTPT